MSESEMPSTAAPPASRSRCAMWIRVRSRYDVRIDIYVAALDPRKVCRTCSGWETALGSVSDDLTRRHHATFDHDDRTGVYFGNAFVGPRTGSTQNPNADEMRCLVNITLQLRKILLSVPYAVENPYPLCLLRGGVIPPTFYVQRKGRPSLGCQVWQFT